MTQKENLPKLVNWRFNFTQEKLIKGDRSPKCGRYLMLVVSLHRCRSNLVIKDVSAFPVNLYFQRFITSW